MLQAVCFPLLMGLLIIFYAHALSVLMFSLEAAYLSLLKKRIDVLCV